MPRALPVHGAKMKLILASLILLSGYSAFAATLTTANYEFEVNGLCVEGVVVCDKVEIIAKATLKKYMGVTVHTLCADRVTPCRFQGYEFTANDKQYFLSDSGYVQVLNLEGEFLEQEEGQWKY